jgi:hypothetical protein
VDLLEFDELPNGWHDAILLGVAFNPDSDEIRFELDAWTGDTQGPVSARYTRLRCTVIFSGIAWFSIDAADPNYEGERRGLIDAGPGFQPLTRTDIPPAAPGTSLSWVYSSSRNSFIHLAAKASRLEHR